MLEAESSSDDSETSIVEEVVCKNNSATKTNVPKSKNYDDEMDTDTDSNDDIINKKKPARYLNTTVTDESTNKEDTEKNSVETSSTKDISITSIQYFKEMVDTGCVARCGSSNSCGTCSYDTNIQENKVYFLHENMTFQDPSYESEANRRYWNCL